MQVKAEDLGGQLRGAMQCVYLVSGDELLLVNEVCDQIVAAARQQGFVERTTYHVEPGFKWHDLYHDAASLSLFAEKKLLDVRLTAKKFDKAASEFLREWTDNDAEADAILMLRCDRLQPKQRASAWFKALEKQGIVVLIWPVSAAQLPRWLSQRLKQQGLQLESDAIQYLCDRVEGNIPTVLFSVIITLGGSPLARQLNQGGLARSVSPVVIHCYPNSIYRHNIHNARVGLRISSGC